ncbi:hypothetical protein RCZ04_06340 [Capnocytophaga sp. HP1101]
MKKTLFLFSALLCFSCGKKEIKAEKGGIDIVSNIYFNASKGLEDMKSVVVSKLNYKGDTIVELVPYADYPEITEKVFIITDTLAFDITERNPQQFIFSTLSKTPSIPKSKKEQGAVFKSKHLLNYGYRKDLNDTILFKKQYKRFRVITPENYTTYYVYQTDTILPYQLYERQGKEYGGRIERIDLYNKQNDVFISLQLLPRKEWDSEAKNIFEFNDFIKKRK